MKTELDKLQQKKNITRGQMQALMTEIMSGRMSEDDMRNFLVYLNEKGPTVEEITGAALIMRRFVLPIQADGDVVLDTCGTGGDGKHTFNISTVAAIVAAAAGVEVAKHGNRSVSSRCGSADVLERLGVRIDLSHERVQECLRTVGIAFMFAQSHHPAMKHISAVRKALGVKTIFNVLGPLTNPARATHQMMGVYSRQLVEQMAHVHRNLGARRVVVAHGADGLDEITTADRTWIADFNGKDVVLSDISPEDFGLTRASESDLKGGDVGDNAEIALAILKGEKGPRRDIVLLNTAFALYAAERVSNPRAGLTLAAETIDAGRAMLKLEELKEFTNRV
ncbi:MAG: anthranilate phosphoribosyltransferase [Candidatus Omnitrophica bacterium]|nr:anthranilate phosphoribosyltransferase [Candidatus Omnitrophota bacterium]